MRSDLPSRLETLLDAFDLAWQQRESPRLEDFLPPEADPDHQAVLIGLVRIDLERRLKRGEPACVESYLGRFPTLRTAAGVLPGLLLLIQDFQQPESVDPQQVALQQALPTTPGSPGQAAPTDVGETWTGRVIAGRYQLLEQIGEGGMGTVWMAEQTEPIRRRIAVKLIRADRGSSRNILARFEAERQAIALMNHPHIAKLLDAGSTDTGTPFFVMELVKGISLTDFCDQQETQVSHNASPCSSRSAQRYNTPTTRASCTAISSRVTSSSKATMGSPCPGSSTSGWPRPFPECP